MFSLKEERRPSRLRGGVVSIDNDGRLGTGFVSMCNCGRAEADDGGERGGEFDAVSPGGEAVEEENEGGDGGGEEEEDIWVGFDRGRLQSLFPTVSHALLFPFWALPYIPSLFYVTIADADVFIATKT